MPPGLCAADGSGDGRERQPPPPFLPGGSGRSCLGHSGRVQLIRAAERPAIQAVPAVAGKLRPRCRRLRVGGPQVAALSGLSLAQMAGQRVILYSYTGLTPPASLLSSIRNGEVGGVIFFSQNGSSQAQIASVIAGRAGTRGGAPSRRTRCAAPRCC